jgi:hypothetical protein
VNNAEPELLLPLLDNFINQKHVDLVYKLIEFNVLLPDNMYQTLLTHASLVPHAQQDNN